MTRDDADEIKKRLNDRLEQMLDRFWKGYVKRGKLAYCAPTGRADDLGSFVVHLAAVGKNPRGKWFRNSAGIGGDELNLFAYGFTGQVRATAEVFQAAREFVGLDDARPETSAERERRENFAAEAAAKREADNRFALERQQARTRTAGEILGECRPLAGTHGEAYFLGRGLPVPPGGWYDSLWFHPSLLINPDELASNWNPAFPCVVCRVDDVVGDVTAIWRIYLDPKKPTKAPIPEPKMGYGTAAGGAIRLGGIAPHIGEAEGVETAIGAHALIKHRYPVWALMSTAGVIGFEPPMEVEWITGFLDGDKPWKKSGDDIVLAEPAGRRANRLLAERLAPIGIRYDRQPEPKIFQDYCDIWNARRRAEALA